MIKMRINKDKETRCMNCNEKYENVEEMYDIKIENLMFNLCRSCSNTLSKKLLKADCLYNGRIKSKEDMSRIYRSNIRRENAKKKL